jgi:hypothetical protein
MASRLKALAPGFLSTEAEPDKPKIGDVRIEEGVARDQKSGEVLSATYRLPDTGEVIRPRAMGAGFELPRNAEAVTPEQRAFKVYVYQKRLDGGPDGFYMHRDNSPGHSGPFDKDGFVLDADGKRQQKFASREAFLLVGEYPDEEKAKRAAEKHL